MHGKEDPRFFLGHMPKIAKWTLPTNMWRLVKASWRSSGSLFWACRQNDEKNKKNGMEWKKDGVLFPSYPSEGFTTLWKD